MSPIDIVESVAAEFGTTRKELMGYDRRAPISRARKVAAIRLRASGVSLPKIARLLGGRHHTTILYYLGRHNSARRGKPILGTEDCERCGNNPPMTDSRVCWCCANG
jgi:hypothetical protein